MEQKDSADAPAPCTGGCGFYGNKIYNGMCSKCFKESQAQAKKGGASQSSIPSAADTLPSSTTKSPLPKSPITSTPEAQVTTNAIPSISPSILPTSPRPEALQGAECISNEPCTPPPAKASSEPPTQNPVVTDRQDPESSSAITSSASTPTGEIPTSIEPNDTDKPVQLNKGRCFKCRIKIPLAKQTVNKCRCNYTFCDSHRYPDRHDCDFDYAKLGRDLLAKNNPKLNQRPKGGRTFQRIDSL